MFVKSNTLVMMSALLLVLGFAAGMWYQSFRLEHAAGQDSIVLLDAAEADSDAEVTAAGPAEIEVFVTGAVRYPQVYRVADDTRVYEAVALAVLLPEAETVGLEMARILADEETVIVPYRSGEGDEAAAVAVAAALASAGGSGGGKININTASLAELDTLPGIGPVLAQRIVDHREQHGKFQEVSDLLNVSGIGDQRLADIEPHITLR